MTKDVTNSPKDWEDFWYSPEMKMAGMSISRWGEAMPSAKMVAESLDTVVIAAVVAVGLLSTAVTARPLPIAADLS